jgi:hypothetical protein
MTSAAIVGGPGTGGWRRVMVVARAQGQFHERHRVIIPRGPPVKLQPFQTRDFLTLSVFSLPVMFVPSLTEREHSLQCSGLRKTLLISVRFEFHE